MNWSTFLKKRYAKKKGAMGDYPPIESKQQFVTKLANHLQNSYLKGVNYVLIDTLDNRRCPNKFLEEYDIQTWNQHIYSLSDHVYQKKLINCLNIPDKT